MVQCEMCGTETSSPTTIKVEGATLDVCSECADFGTAVESQSSESSSSTKYSTGTSEDTTSSSRSSTGSSASSSQRRQDDMFDAVDTLAQDYDSRIRQAREERGLTQAELANQLKEKASLIRKVERGDTLPSDDLQSKLESFLDISLSAGGSEGETADWQSDTGADGYTLGDVVERKD